MWNGGGGYLEAGGPRGVGPTVIGRPPGAGGGGGVGGTRRRRTVVLQGKKKRRKRRRSRRWRGSVAAGASPGVLENHERGDGGGRTSSESGDGLLQLLIRSGEEE